MNFLWVTLQVRDMEESLRFYQDVIGLAIDRRFTAGPTEIAFLGKGETKVELIQDGSEKWKGQKTGISIGFQVPSLDETIAMIKEKGLTIQSGPFQPNPHVRFFYILDPNGVTVQFVEDK